MLISSLFLSSAAFAAVLGDAVRPRNSYSVKEKHTVSRRWTAVDRAPRSHMIHLQIGLKQSNFEELERHLNEVSDPDHPRYGQHLSYKEVNDLIKPKTETLDAVHQWLSDEGIDVLSRSPAQDWINIYVDIESAERLLDTRYLTYKHDDGSELVRTSEWSLPNHLHEMIDTIQPTTSFMRSEPQKRDWGQFSAPWVPYDYTPPTSGPLVGICHLFPVTIECLRTLYGTINYTPASPGFNQIAFNNFENEVPVRPDIALFLQEFRPESYTSAYTFASVEIDGGPAASFFNLDDEQLAANKREGNLDAQTILGMVYPTPVTSFSIGGKAEKRFEGDFSNPYIVNEPFMTWVNYALGQESVPQVVSSSYGMLEEDVPLKVAIRVCRAFATLGARGVSLLFPSGDDGLGDEDGTNCFSNDGLYRKKFVPMFPASCPYVTTVGATQEFEPEVAAWRPSVPGNKKFNFYASGSGFSNYFARPEYQDGVVDDYLAALPYGMYGGAYNKNGRAYPDISAQGLYYAFVLNQTFTALSGTSASTPLAASVLSLVNDYRISQSQPVLGFLNPWLYKIGRYGFNDITGGLTASCGVVGFPVTEGWDPVTGFGTPNFPKLIKISVKTTGDDDDEFVFV